MLAKYGNINADMINASSYYRSGIRNLDTENYVDSYYVSDMVNSLEFLFISKNCPDKTIFDLLVGNIVLLLPIVFDNYSKHVKSNLRLFNSYTSFSNNYNEEYTNSSRAESVKDELDKFRNALQHGLYDIEYENGEPYLKYRYHNRNSFIYKKIALNELLRFTNDALKYSYNSSTSSKEWCEENRTAIAIVNNMKILCYCKSMSGSGYEFQNTIFTENHFLIMDDNFFEEMKYASIFAEFYSLYQKNLETMIGPNLYVASRTNNIAANYLNKTGNGEYFDFSILTGALVAQRTSDISLSTKMKNEVVNVEPVNDKLDRLLEKLNVLHHIRNAFAHGNVRIKSDGRIFVEDRDKVGNITYTNVHSIAEFEELLKGDNHQHIYGYLSNKSRRVA